MLLAAVQDNTWSLQLSVNLASGTQGQENAAVTKAGPDDEDGSPDKEGSREKEVQSDEGLEDGESDEDQSVEQESDEDQSIEEEGDEEQSNDEESCEEEATEEEAHRDASSSDADTIMHITRSNLVASQFRHLAKRQAQRSRPQTLTAVKVAFPRT